MENMFNAKMQSSASVAKVMNNDSLSGVSNPIKRNKLVPPPLDGLASREYASAIRSLALAQLNLPTYKCTPKYYNY